MFCLGGRDGLGDVDEVLVLLYSYMAISAVVLHVFHSSDLI